MSGKSMLHDFKASSTLAAGGHKEPVLHSLDNIVWIGEGANGCVVSIPNPKCAAPNIWSYGPNAMMKLPYYSKASVENDHLKIIKLIDPAHEFTVPFSTCVQAPEVINAAAAVCVKHSKQLDKTRFGADAPVNRFLARVGANPEQYNVLMQYGGVELMASAVFKHLIRQKHSSFTLRQLLVGFAPLFNGACVMAAHGIMHMDIKPENVLAQFDDGVFVRLNLIDFGNATRIETLLNLDMKTRPGLDYPYSPPEIMLAAKGPETTFSLPSETLTAPTYYFSSYTNLVILLLAHVERLFQTTGVLSENDITHRTIGRMLLFDDAWNVGDPVRVNVKSAQLADDMIRLRALREESTTFDHASEWRAKFMSAHAINGYGVGATMIESVIDIGRELFKPVFGSAMKHAHALLVDLVDYCQYFIHPIPWKRKMFDNQWSSLGSAAAVTTKAAVTATTVKTAEPAETAAAAKALKFQNIHLNYCKFLDEFSDVVDVSVDLDMLRYEYGIIKLADDKKPLPVQPPLSTFDSPIIHRQHKVRPPSQKLLRRAALKRQRENLL